MAIRFLSVCSGIEAASVAWGGLGWEASGFSEIEPFPSAVLAHHYPNVTNYGDMTTIARRVLTGEVSAPDVFCGGTPCFTAGHMVITQRGYVPIEEIVVGDMVVTHKGRLRRVVRIGSKIARVGRLSGVGLGEKIYCTPDHPFRSVEWRMQNTKRGNKYERVEHIGDPSWTAAKDMPGSQWCALTAVSVDAPVMPDGIDADELLYIAGFYLGDGFIRRWADANKKAVVFGVNDEKVDRFKARVTQSVSVFRERTGPRIVLGNTAIADWLIENFGEYSHAKTLPAWVLAHPQRAALMDGYRDTDGHCTANGWRAISVSRALAYGMRDLAQTLGMVASVAFTKVEPTKTIEGRKVNQRDYWTVTAFNGETSRKSRIRHGMLLRTVSAFEEVGDETVFNIEVDEDHSYVLDGVIVHNCQAFSVAGLRNGLSDHRGQLTLSFVELADAIDSARFIRGQQPAVIVWENVPGVLSSKDNAFGCFLGALAGEDCELQPSGGKWTNAGCVFGPKRAIAWRILDAQYFGVAQRRRRVFVVASAREGFDPTTVLFEFDGVRRNSPPSREKRESVTSGAGCSAADSRKWPADIASCLNAHFGDKQGLEDQHINQGAPLFVPAAFAFDSLSSNSMRSSNPHSGCRAVDVAKTLDTTIPCPSKNQGGIGVLSYGIPGNWINRKPENGGNAVEPMRDIAPCLTKTDQHGVAHYPVYSTHPPCIGRAPNDGPQGKEYLNDGSAYCMDSRGQPQAVAFGVSENPHLAHCLRSGASKADKHESTTYVTQHMAVRRLTPVEYERLQGFPDNWTRIPWRKKPAEECPDGPRYKALGNSMAVPVMAWIGKRIDREVSNEKTL